MNNKSNKSINFIMFGNKYGNIATLGKYLILCTYIIRPFDVKAITLLPLI